MGRVGAAPRRADPDRVRAARLRGPARPLTASPSAAGAILDYAIGEATYLVSFGSHFLEMWLYSEGYTADFARMQALFQESRGRSCTSSPECP